MTINIFYNLSSKLTTTRLALMISSRVKDTVSSLTFLVPLVLVSDLHIKRQMFLVELISFFFFVFKGKLSRPKLRVVLFVGLCMP